MGALAALARSPARTAFVVALLLYLPTLAFPFLDWDDFMYVARNPRIQDTSLAGLLQLWNPETALLGKFVEFFPLRDSLYWLTWALAPKNAAAFHLVNVVAHASACAVVVVFAGRLGLDAHSRLLAGLLFGVHPAHVESVAWVSGLKDPLFTVFALLSLCFLIDADEGKRGRWLWSLLALVAALLCKSLAIAVPVVGFAWLLARRQRLGLIFPHVVVVALFLLIFMAVGEANDVLRPARDGSRLTGLFTGAWCFARYLQLALLPAGLSPFHAVVPYPAGIEDLRSLVGIAAVAVVAVIGLRAVVKQQATVAVVVALFVAPLLPVLHLVPIPIDLADRFLYLPLVALALVVGVVGSRHLWVALVLCGGLGGLTLVTQRAWADDVDLWLTAVESDGGLRSMPWMVLGSAYQARGRLDEAEDALAQGLRQHRSSAGWAIGRDHRRVAELAFAHGDLPRAEAHARIAAVASDDPESWGLLSHLARRRGDTQTAVQAAVRARAGAPDDVRMMEAYGRALVDAGNADRARRELQRSVNLDPSACARLAALLHTLGSDLCRP